ncbi:hypothetical protein [Fluviispira multicolorata]|uniref:Uncharacterized protein n=1 Tax=Fluviispira multicolorata TaxID=2654512 RepID=A0A833JFR0_9BACT|nr:hypothetical protein [Fluviispira multicolorata]KAB8033485.1 hypothetical protein GCL57_01925 [Fluviispira multicolorata]
MNSSFDINSKKTQMQATMTSDILGSEVETFDIGTNALFKIALYLGVPSGSSDVDDVFLDILKKSLSQNSKLSFQRFFTLLSFHYFKKRFVPQAIYEVKQLRTDWLLGQCVVSELSGLDSKGAQHYFNTLEQRVFVDYITGWPSLHNWLELEFQKIRKKFLISLLKKYSNFILFWCLIILAVFIGLHITSKENSLTMWEQIQGWIGFITQRLR